MTHHASPCLSISPPALRRIAQLLLAILIPIACCSTALAQPMRGVFTVGGNGSNYPTLALAAASVTNRGVVDHVTFIIRSGTYTATSPVLFGPIEGAGPNATITLRPDSGATVRITGNLSQRSTVTLRGSSYVIFEGRAIKGDTLSRMTIVNTNSANGSCAVVLDSNTDNSVIRHCTLISNSGTGTVTYSGSGACVWIRGLNGGCGSDSNVIEENVIGDVNGNSRATCGVLVEGGDFGDPNSNRGNVVRGNTIINMGRSGSDAYGVQVESFCMGTTIANNTVTITRPTGVKSLTGISDNSSSNDDGNNCLIEGNRIWGLASTAAETRVYTGIAVGGTSAGAGVKVLIPTRVTVRNNMIAMTINGRREEAHGIVLTAYQAGANFSFHAEFNSIMVRDTSARDSTLYYNYSTPLDVFATALAANKRPEIQLRNNLWDLAINGGDGWHIECDGCRFSSDYNLVSISQPFNDQGLSVSYRNGQVSYMGEWAGLNAATSFEQHSIEGPTQFSAPALGDLHIVQCGTSLGKGRAQPMADVTVDIDGEARSATAPDIGADETGGILKIDLPPANTRVLAERPFEVWFTPQKSMWVSVDISCDGGATWQTLGNFEAFGGFSNAITPIAPATPCAAAMLRVRGSDGRSCDILNGTISIYRPTVQVTAPNGGEHYLVDDSVDIRWTSTDAGQVRIDYRSAKATVGLWSTIASGVNANLGTYRWGVPAVADSTYEVRVVVTSPISAEDQSDNTFTVEVPTPHITVLSPNGREVLLVGSTAELRWNTENVSGRGIIEWSPDNAGVWVGIDTVADVTSGSYQWSVPDTVTTNALLRVRAYDGSAQDASDRVWNILHEAPGSNIVVVYPNGGENLRTNTVDSIVWNAPPDIDSVQIQYSSDGGANWLDVAASTPSVAGRNHFVWNTPAVPATTPDGLVRVVELGAVPTPRADTSNAPFTFTLQLGGVAGGDLATGVTISPNPVHDGFTLRWSGKGPTSLHLRSLSGVSVWTGNVQPGTSSLAVPLAPGLPAGLYLLEYTTGNRTLHLPVTIVR